MSDEREVAITLSPAQVAQVIRQASGGVADVLAGSDHVRELASSMLPLLDDNTYSRTTIRAVLTLAAFPTDGSEREITDVAREVGQSPSTTHRYVRTWVAIGELEQEPYSRRYRRPRPPRGAAGESPR